MKKHIIAIGGGGFGRKIGDLKVEKYIASISKKNNPKICFIPTATGDSDSYKVSFYSAFSRVNCRPSHIDMFKRTVNLEEHISEQDIIYVGGGNTKSMLAVWRDWGLDLILKNAYDKGLILSGVSAGAICWFSKGITDSWDKNLNLINCLGFVDGACCPHIDEEKERMPYLSKLIKKGILKECMAIEGHSALHLVNGKPFMSLNFGNNKKSYLLSLNKNKITSNFFNIKDI